MQTLKNGVAADDLPALVVVAKEYPRPTLEQLNQLGEIGELVYTKSNEPRYPDVLSVNTGTSLLPWWVVLGVQLY